MKTFQEFQEATKACGLCYKYAYQQIMKDKKLTLIHATVHDPWDGHAYTHAWVENGRLAMDWQTMVNGFSKYGKKGWPIKEFYNAYDPKDIKKYTQDEVLKQAAKTKQYGPW